MAIVEVDSKDIENVYSQYSNKSVNNPMDEKTKKLLDKVTNDINTNNAKLGSNARLYYTTAQVNGPVANTYLNNSFTPTLGSYNTYGTGFSTGISNVGNYQEVQTPVVPSPNIDMNNEIYKNEFEESGIVEIGRWNPERDITGFYTAPPSEAVSIGLIDAVSENEEDLYAKFPDGEIIPFKGHQEKFSIKIETWNDLKRSDLIGSEVKKAATCRIFINDRLARIIEDTEVQNLLIKADRAIDELKTQPFSICRDGESLIARKIYYDNQPAIIIDIDELDNFIKIVPDIKYINNFIPPAYSIEEGESEDWIAKFGNGMMVRDYDEKIWWWRDTKSNGGADLDNDPFYGQFPQPAPIPPIPSIPSIPNIPNPSKYPGVYTPYNPWDTTTTFVAPNLHYTSGDTKDGTFPGWYFSANTAGSWSTANTAGSWSTIDQSASEQKSEKNKLSKQEFDGVEILDEKWSTIAPILDEGESASE